LINPHVTRAPYVMLKSAKPWDRSPPAVADTTVGWRFTNPRLRPEWTVSLGETAEAVAELCGIGREDQDRFALESQRRAQAALAAGVFDEEIVPVELPRGGRAERVSRDEPPRGELTLADLAALKPAFRAGGTVTAGTSSGINDGAAALAVVSRAAAAELGLQPLARIVASAAAGVDPGRMGLGPVPATRKALARAGLSVGDLDLVELNEAFAAQALACIGELGLDPARVNIYGGAIALGHPLGASGARILTTLVHGLRRTGGRYGLATMCIGVGQGIAMVVEAGA
jgi:acetyl-CoA acetyltransferase family protein